MYYAIVRRNGGWEYLCSGPEPAELYREAINILDAEETYPEEEEVAMNPDIERLYDSLRVVDEEMAREQYHVSFTRAVGDTSPYPR